MSSVQRPKSPVVGCVVVEPPKFVALKSIGRHLPVVNWKEQDPESTKALNMLVDSNNT
jgi:hypothetical protein